MARGQVKKTETTNAVRYFTCADCRWFVRDTSGISRTNATGEYFMGICKKGANPDHTIGKQFANKPRTEDNCKHYIHK